MPLRALRPNRSDRDLQRRSTIDPIALFKRDRDHQHQHQQQPPVPDIPQAHRLAVSEDGRRPSSPELSRFRSHPDHAPDDAALSPPRTRPSPSPSAPSSRRFSLMRFRHASDPQLSAKAKEHAARDDIPPVPAVPAVPALPVTATPDSKPAPLPPSLGIMLTSFQPPPLSSTPTLIPRSPQTPTTPMPRPFPTRPTKRSAVACTTSPCAAAPLTPPPSPPNKRASCASPWTRSAGPSPS